MDFDWDSLMSGTPNPFTDPTLQQQPMAPKYPGQMPGAPTAMPASPIAPEAMAANLAARGVPPPPVDAAPQQPLAPIRMPDNNVGSSTWRNDYDTMAGSGPGDVGAALTGKTVGAGGPQDITSQAQKDGTASSTDISASAKKPEDKMGKFAEALKGLKAPAKPELQKLGTPAAPRATAIKGGDVLALLQSLNAAPGASSYNLPSTLGAALRRG